MCEEFNGGNGVHGKSGEFRRCTQPWKVLPSPKQWTAGIVIKLLNGDNPGAMVVLECASSRCGGVRDMDNALRGGDRFGDKDTAGIGLSRAAGGGTGLCMLDLHGRPPF